MGPKAGLDVMEKRKKYFLSTGIRTTDRPARSLVSRLSGSTKSTPLLKIKLNWDVYFVPCLVFSLFRLT
jgi:hypothetical protein